MSVSLIQQRPMQFLSTSSPYFAGAAVLLACVVRLSCLMAGPQPLILASVPDDAFYYLVLAKNFASAHEWTFDGVSPASGFHLFWGYLISTFYSLVPKISFRALFFLSGTISSLMFTVAAAILAAAADKTFGRVASIGVVVIFLGPASIIQPTLMMETSAVVLFASALFYQISVTSEGSAISKKRLILIAGLGFFGMLSRSDFGLLPLAMFCLSLYFWSRHRDSSSLLVASSALAGAVVGFAIIVLHTHAISGALIPASADIKSYWAQVNGPTIVPGYEIVQRLVTPFMDCFVNWQKTFSPVYIGTLMLVGVFTATQAPHRQLPVYVIGVAILSVAGYLLLYRHNGAVQVWYAANFIVPLGIIAGPPFGFLARRWPIGIALCVLAFGCWSLVSSLRPIWPWQDAMRRAGLFLKENPGIEPVGAWNAGIMSFYSERKVINLDGLVNDFIAPYVRSGNLGDYLTKRQVKYLIDFPAMLSADVGQTHGYKDGKLKACSHPKTAMPVLSPSDSWGNSYITIYDIDLACLRL